jgi:beta propeller domain-containing protein
MHSRLPFLLVLGLIVLAAAGAGAGTSSGESGQAKPRAARLQAFGSCGELLQYAKLHATKLVGPWGLGGAIGDGREGGVVPAPATDVAKGTPGVDYSTTNVQEAGIDEPDVVKTNGSHVFAVAQGKLHAIDVRSGRPRLVGSVELAGGWSHELLLHGKRLLVISQGARWMEPLPGIARSSFPVRESGTFLASIDVSDPTELRVVQTLELEGSYLTARLAGGTARIVVNSSVPGELEFDPPETDDPQASAAATEHNRAVIASSGLSSWLPRYALENRRTGTRTEKVLAQCRQIRKPAQFSGLGMLTVLTIDLDEGLNPVDSDAVMTDGQIVYASDRSLIVATQRWDGRPVPAADGEQPERTKTALHRFGIVSRSETVYRASGEVPGTLLNQWSLSEDDGALRVASTEFPLWWTPEPGQESESFVSVLQEREGKLVTVGRVGELGRGERIYAVRFMGDVGYVVTFRQVDPLYTIDLSDPEKPRVLGALKILGYSSYLHPVDDELMLGLGQDATDQGRVLGSQLSLFDVGNLRKPERLHRRTIGPGSSEAEYDHHAFLYWRPSRLVVVPVQTYSFAEDGKDGSSFVGAIALKVGRGSGFDELGRIVHLQTVDQGGGQTAEWQVPIRRSLVVGNTLYTYSDAGLKANDLRTLAAEGWVEFPRPPEVPVVGGKIDPSPVPGAVGGSEPARR